MVSPPKPIVEIHQLGVLRILMALLDPKENFCNQELRPGGFFDAWDRRTAALAFMFLLDATIGNLLLQEFSALTKCITKAFCVGNLRMARNSNTG